MRELTFTEDDDKETSGVEVDPTKIQSLKYVGDSWVNKELDPIRLPIVCRVAQEVLISMRTIEKLMTSNGLGLQEFGVYLKGELSPEGILSVHSDLYVPKQKVTGASIDFEEESPAGFNGVIHRHPSGCTSFSGTDYSYINKNFEFSLLYVNNEITMGIINLSYKNGLRLQLPLGITIMYPIFSGFDDVIGKIEAKKTERMSIGDDFVNRKHNNGGYLPGLSVEDDEDRLRFPDDSPSEDDGDDILDSKMYQCKICGETQEIDEFPHDCEGCDAELDQTMVIFIDDLDADAERPE